MSVCFRSGLLQLANIVKCELSGLDELRHHGLRPSAEKAQNLVQQILASRVPGDTRFKNIRVAEDTYRVRFECPELARSILPGQFLMIRLADCDDPVVVHKFASMLPAFEFEARPVIPIEDAVRGELEVMAWRDGLKFD